MKVTRALIKRGAEPVGSAPLVFQVLDGVCAIPTSFTPGCPK